MSGIAHAGLGIAGDAHRRREIGRGIEAGRGHRHRQQLQAAVGPAQIVAADDHLLAARIGDHHRRHRARDGVEPGRTDFLDRAAHTDGVNRGRGRKRADRDRDVIAPALGIDDVGEQERAAIGLGDAADELPAHQGMKLGVLVDRTIDPHQQPGLVERGEMLLEIERRAAGGSAAKGLNGGGVVHDRAPLISLAPE
jgi:hypothetical protein